MTTCLHGVQTGHGYECSACVTTPAAAAQPFVGMTNFELARILAGNALTCRTSTGEEVIVRLFTADEFLTAHATACASFGMEPSVSRAKADELTTPIGGNR